MLHSTVLCCTVLYCTVLYCTVLYYTKLCRATLYSNVQSFSLICLAPVGRLGLDTCGEAVLMVRSTAEMKTLSKRLISAPIDPLTR
jgi:hypothetical protein